MTEKFTILKLRLEADKMLILVGFILFTLFLAASFSVLPIKTSADSNSLNIYKTARNVTNQESNWQKTINANPGDKIAFSIRLDANSSSNLYNVFASDNLPSQFSYASGSTKIDNNSASDGIVSSGINIGTINSGQSKTITFEAYVSSSNQYYGNTYTNYAHARSDNINQVSDRAQIYIGRGEQYYNQSYLTLKKTVQNINKPNGTDTNNTAQIGDALRYTFVYTNTGNSAVYNIKIIDDLPSYLSIISAENGGIYDERTNKITWSIRSILADGTRSGSVSYLAKVLNPPSSTIIRNSGLLRANNVPEIYSNEVATTIGAISPVAAAISTATTQGKSIRAVTGANDILFNILLSLLISLFGAGGSYLALQNSQRFTKLRLSTKSFGIRIKDKIRI